MKELLEGKKHMSTDNARELVLLDTCFILYMLEHNKLKDLLSAEKIGITSFNLAELLHVEGRVGHNIKKSVRTFLKNGTFVIVDVTVEPGNAQREKDYVNSVDDELLKHIADPSDAVLVAAAILTKSTVVTKDKHHLFTAKLENYLQNKGVVVRKSL